MTIEILGNPIRTKHLSARGLKRTFGTKDKLLLNEGESEKSEKVDPDYLETVLRFACAQQPLDPIRGFPRIFPRGDIEWQESFGRRHRIVCIEYQYDSGIVQGLCDVREMDTDFMVAAVRVAEQRLVSLHHHRTISFLPSDRNSAPATGRPRCG
jgi:hypothetical protein